MAFPVNPSPHAFPFLLTLRNNLPVVRLAAWSQSSTSTFTQLGLGIVRVRPALPFRSTIAQCSSAKLQVHRFVSPDPACEQDSQPCAIAFAPQLIDLRRMPQPLRLFGREPIAKPDIEFLDTFDPPNTGCQIRTQKPAICRLVSQPADCPEPEIDRPRRQTGDSK